MVSPARPAKPGHMVTYPNRDKRSSRVTRTAVAVVLAGSALLMLLVTFGGWSKLDGLEPLNIIWCVVYLVMAVYVMRWARELLPIATAAYGFRQRWNIESEVPVAGAGTAAAA